MQVFKFTFKNFGDHDKSVVYVLEETIEDALKKYYKHTQGIAISKESIPPLSIEIFQGEVI